MKRLHAEKGLDFGIGLFNLVNGANLKVVTKDHRLIQTEEEDTGLKK